MNIAESLKLAERLENRVTSQSPEYVKAVVLLAKAYLMVNDENSTLTEQLRLANEDAERLAPYWSHLDGCQYNMSGEYDNDLCDCGCIEALRLHKKREEKE